MTRRLLIPIFLVAAASSSALAQPAASAQQDPKDLAAQDCTRARKLHQSCTLTFTTGTDIAGSSPTGDGTSVTVVGHHKMPSLIHVRTDFRAEIIKSAEDID